jgi:hypothetical protein
MDRLGRTSLTALRVALCLLAVLVVTILCFLYFAPATVPSHVGFSGEASGQMSKKTVLFVISPIALVISGGLLIRAWAEAIPLSVVRVPFVFYSQFWIGEGREDYLRRRMIEFVRIASSISSLFFSITLWSQLATSLGHPLPDSVSAGSFWFLAAVLAWAIVRNYRRLRPSEWEPGSGTDSDQ